MAVYSALLIVAAISAIDGAFHNRIIPSSRRLYSADDNIAGGCVGFSLVAQAAANERDVEEALLRAQSALAADMGEEISVCVELGES